MGVRAALIQDWRDRLQADELQLDSAAPRSAWLLRARARIYRLLLAMYGEGDWRADCADKRVAEFHAVPLAPSCPPKSLATIRKTLKSVRSAVDAPPAGKAAGGAQARSITATGWTIVFTSYSWSEMSAVCCLMRVRGIEHVMHDCYLLVAEADRERALAAMASDRRARADLRNRALDANNRSARYNLAILLSLLFGSFLTFAIIPRLRAAHDWQPGEIATAYFAASAIWVAAALCLNAARKR